LKMADKQAIGALDETSATGSFVTRATSGLKNRIALLPYPAFLRLFEGAFFLRSRSRAKYVMWRAGIPSLEQYDFKSLKRTDILFVLGSGSSINRISPERWKIISAYDSVGFNFWLFHPFVPTMYFFENIDTFYIPTMTRAFLKVASERAADYRNTPKVAMDLHKFGPTTVFDLPKTWRHALYGVHSSVLPARNESELAYGLSYLIRRGIFDRSDRFEMLFKYCTTVTLMISLAVRLGYKKIVLCGVDLKDSRYFYQDPDLYPQTKNLEFLDCKKPHLTDVVTAWRLPVSTVLMEMKRQILDPSGVELYVENRNSALFPEIAEVPAVIFQKKSTRTYNMQAAFPTDG
jgi:hypothetical protein